MKTTWGIIGCGDVCEHKGGPPLYRTPGNTLTACYRRNAELGRDFARRHGPAEYCESLSALLSRDDVDAVYVATPPAQHESDCIQAATAGKHILVEKPMAADSAACERIVKACEEAGVTLGVAYYRRGYESIQRLKAWIDSKSQPLSGTMLLNDTFPLSHRLDLVHCIAGDITEATLQHDVLPLREVETQAGEILNLSTSSGLQAKVGIRWGERPNHNEQISITLETGDSFHIDDLKGGRYRINDEQHSCAGLPWTHTGLIRNWVQYIYHKGVDLLCNGSDGLRSTVVLDWVSALQLNQTVTIDYSAPPRLDQQRAVEINLLG